MLYIVGMIIDKEYTVNCVLWLPSPPLLNAKAQWMYSEYICAM